MMIGTYPPMVKAVLQGQRPSLGDALAQSVRKFWAILGATVILAIIYGIGLIAIILPGVIFMTWYAYTVPSIMLDDKGTLDGMSAGRDFAKDKKTNTFTIILIFVAGAFVSELIELGFTFVSPLLGHLIFALLEVPLFAWLFVILSCVYISYGPSAQAPPSPGQVETTTPSTLAPSEPPSPGAAAPARYCAFCGASLKESARFCSSCGKSV